MGDDGGAAAASHSHRCILVVFVLSSYLTTCNYYLVAQMLLRNLKSASLLKKIFEIQQEYFWTCVCHAKELTKESGWFYISVVGVR